MSSHAQIRPQGAEKQLRKVVVGGWVVVVVVGVWPKTRTAPAQNQIRSAELVNKSESNAMNREGLGFCFISRASNHYKQ